MLGRLQREEALLHFRRGLVLERANRSEEAVREYRRAIDYNPYLCEARSALADFYRRRGLTTKAVEELRIVANLQDDFLAHYQLGCMLTEVGQLDLAIDALERCRSQAPNDPLVRYRLAAAHFLRGDYAAALTQLGGCYNTWELSRLRGDCLLRLGSYEAAHDAYMAAASLAPPSAQAELAMRIRSAVRYHELGQVQTVRDWLYGEHGAVLIGSPQLDAGQREPADYPLTYPDIGAILRRLAALITLCGWRFSCVAPVDRAALPVVRALSMLLGLPAHQSDPLASGEQPLLILASGYHEELSILANERAAGRATLFCLGLAGLRSHGIAPEIVGVAAQGTCGTPWETELRRLRADGSAPVRITACLEHATQRVLTAVETAPLDPGLGALVAYYERRRDVVLKGSQCPDDTQHSL